VSTFLGAQGTNGDNYILGIDMWAWGDSATWQHTNWGIITNRDNAYNGTEDVDHSILDSGGYTTIPEDANYGDFLTPITATNNSILQQLIYEWQH
jgi:hypothetical protein